jgi:hypothetical protein
VVQERGSRRTHLVLDVAALIVAVGSSSKGSARLISACNSTALCEVLLTLGPTDLYLLLLAAAAELIRLESALCLECCAAMLGDVAVGHGWGRRWVSVAGECSYKGLCRCLQERGDYYLLEWWGREKAETARASALDPSALAARRARPFPSTFTIKHPRQVE